MHATTGIEVEALSYDYSVSIEVSSLSNIHIFFRVLYGLNIFLVLQLFFYFSFCNFFI